MKVDFSSILDQEIGQAEAPSPVPEGTYKGQIEGVPKFNERNVKGVPKLICTVNVSLQEAGDDVDSDDLTAAGGLTRESGEAKRVPKDFWLDSDSLYQFDQFLASFGLSGGMSYAAAVKELSNRSVTVYVIQDTFTAKGGSEVTNNKVKSIYANE